MNLVLAHGTKIAHINRSKLLQERCSFVNTPKEQRPRKLSGKRTVIISKIWREAYSANMLTEGDGQR